MCTITKRISACISKKKQDTMGVQANWVAVDKLCSQPPIGGLDQPRYRWSPHR